MDDDIPQPLPSQPVSARWKREVVRLTRVRYAEEDPGDPPPDRGRILQYFDPVAEDPWRAVRCVWRGDQMVAYGEIRAPSGTSPGSMFVFVDPAHRRQGLARRLSYALVRATPPDLDFVIRAITVDEVPGGVGLCHHLGAREIEADAILQCSVADRDRETDRRAERALRAELPTVALHCVRGRMRPAERGGRRNPVGASSP